MGALLSALLLLGTLVAPAQARQLTGCTPDDWAQYGHDAGHSFAARCTTITTLTARTLVPRWVVHTNDSVSASPAVVGGVVYVGDWSGRFHAVDAKTGAERWTFDITSASRVAFGRIVSSAAVTTQAGRRMVLFGGGSALYALDAATGHLLASIDLDPRSPALRTSQAANPPEVEVESSPSVVGDRVYVGIDVHNRAKIGRTGVVALRIAHAHGRWSLEPVWKSDGESGAVYKGRAGLTAGSGTGFGCGGVWSSPAVDAAAGLVFYGTASCSNPEAARAAKQNFAESMVAVRVKDGRLVWRFRPADHVDDPIGEAHYDDDFGASPNLVRTRNGRSLVGEGRKSAEYFARDRRTGRAGWRTLAGSAGHAGNDFAVGGFLGTTAVETDPKGVAVRIVGATAIPTPRSASDAERATWAVRALDPETGAVQWTYRLTGPSYGATTIASGVAFVPDTTTDSLLALDTSNGLPLWNAPLIGPPSSAAVVVGDAVYGGSGTREGDIPGLSELSGIYCFGLPG